MKNNKSSQNPDTDSHYINYGGLRFPLQVYNPAHFFFVGEQTNL